MDISLIEEKMEESIKHLYELNSVVRMSLIEMQFIKKVSWAVSPKACAPLKVYTLVTKLWWTLKELLSALVAMDELMGSNEINMRIAAMVSWCWCIQASDTTISYNDAFRVLYKCVDTGGYFTRGYTKDISIAVLCLLQGQFPFAFAMPLVH